MTGMMRVADVDSKHLHSLNSGHAQSRTLTEALAVDHLVLLQNVMPNVPAELSAAVAAAQPLGILKRMQAIGTALHHHLPAEACQDLAHHASDTVRGWAAFAVAADPRNADVERLLTHVRPASDDLHFTVREWVWMAARPHLAADLDRSIGLLADWTSSPSERVRRFSSEALRPRGVWARHISELKQDPDLGIPILEPLKADSTRYVQDSVANWINDASKTSPDWTRALCRRWSEESSAQATERIIARALRSLS